MGICDARSGSANTIAAARFAQKRFQFWSCLPPHDVNVAIDILVYKGIVADHKVW